MNTRELIGSVGWNLVAGARALAAPHDDDPQPTPAAGPLKIQVVVFDDFQLSDGLIPYDVLMIAAQSGASVETKLVTLTGAPEVTAFGGVVIKVPDHFDPEADLLIVPGAPRLWRDGVSPAGLAEALQAFHAAGKVVTSVCTGAVFVARAGLLAGRNATTNHLAFDAIAAEGANVIHTRTVDDGDIITSAGVTSGLDHALYLIERYFGAAPAIAVQEIIEYERRSIVWKKG